ncbi:MAG: HIT family protein [Desulfurococcales archaeon]|nr:HIT family protein [Desulfurococcales archaeon]
MAGGGCIFCNIARGEAPAHIVYEDDSVAVFLDIYPVEKGHLLVIPRSHYESVADAPPRVAARVFATAAALARLYREALGAPGVNVVANSGRPAGQEVFHFHVHVIPRWRGGGWRTLFMRHRLTEDEAREVLEMWRPLRGSIGEYVRGAFMPG